MWMMSPLLPDQITVTELINIAMSPCHQMHPHITIITSSSNVVCKCKLSAYYVFGDCNTDPPYRNNVLHFRYNCNVSYAYTSVWQTTPHDHTLNSDNVRLLPFRSSPASKPSKQLVDWPRLAAWLVLCPWLAAAHGGSLSLEERILGLT